MGKKINALFWTIWTASFILSFIESVTYSGFVLEKSGIGINVIVIIVGFFAALILLLRFIKRDLKPRRSDKTVLIFFVFVLTLYVVLKVLNRLTSVNFVFSKIHVLPDSLKWPVLISLLPVAIAWIPRINFKKLLKIQSIIIIPAFIIIALNLNTIYRQKWRTFQFIIANPNATYDEKMAKAIGDIFYNYSLFIDKYTPESASLLIPPQAFPWPGSGNIGYFRYFVFPRNIISGNEFNPPSKDILDKIDYVLLNWGETDMVEPPHTHDWPKFDVKAEKIIFMNEDGSFKGEVNGNYYYKDYKGKRVWGLIVIKH